MDRSHFKACDLDELEKYLAKRTNKAGRLIYTQTEIAVQVGLSTQSISTAFRILTNEGALTKLRSRWYVNSVVRAGRQNAQKRMAVKARSDDHGAGPEG